MLTYLGPRLLFHYSLSFFVNSPSPAVVLHDYIMKLRSYTSYVGNVVYAHQKLVAYVSVRFFFFSFSAAHFHLAGC